MLRPFLRTARSAVRHLWVRVALSERTPPGSDGRPLPLAETVRPAYLPILHPAVAAPRALPAANPATGGASPRSVFSIAAAQTEHALRNLHHLALLANAELLDMLPYTLDYVLAGQQVPPPDRERRLVQARALRTTLLAAIDGFKPRESSDRQSLHHRILLLEYVHGRPNRQIQMSLGVSPATFYRHRQRAVAALTAELVERESLLQRAAQRTVAPA